MRFVFSMKRKSNFYVMVIIVPTFIITTLSITGVFAKRLSGEDFIGEVTHSFWWIQPRFFSYHWVSLLWWLSLLCSESWPIHYPRRIVCPFCVRLFSFLSGIIVDNCHPLQRYSSQWKLHWLPSPFLWSFSIPECYTRRLKLWGAKCEWKKIISNEEWNCRSLPGTHFALNHPEEEQVNYYF